MDRHIKALDGLRGAAVAAVLLFHAGHLTGGYLGVDLFFVLSGFLITSLLLREQGKSGQIDLKNFWVRRARRLLPALFAMLVGVAFYAVVFAPADELARIRNDTLATAGYVANWSSIFGNTGYFDQFASPSPLQHTWSLAIEEQFYVIWPLIAVGLLVLLKVSSRVFMAVCIAMAAVSFGAMLLLFTPDTDPTRVYMGTDTRASSILIGAAIAAAVKSWGYAERPASRTALQAAGWVAFGFLAVAWVFLDGNWNITYQGGLLLCGLAAGALIAAAAHPGGGWLSKVFSVVPLVYLGTISYGLYLWHWPIYLALNESRTGLEGWPLTILRLAVSFGVALVSFYLLEKPIRNGALSRTLAPRWAVMSAPLAAVLVCLLVIVVSFVGAPPPETASAQRPVAADAPKVMFVGDSGAEQLGERFDEIAGELQLRIDNQAHKGCPMWRADGSVKALSGDKIIVEGPECGKDIKSITATSQPDVALVNMAGPALSLLLIDGDYKPSCDPANRKGFEERLRAMLADITANGTKALVTTTAEVEQKPADKPDFISKTNESTVCINEIIRAVQASTPNTALIDLREWICPDGKCRKEQDGVELRTDGVHFKGEGGRVAARWLAGEIRKDLPAAKKR